MVELRDSVLGRGWIGLDWMDWWELSRISYRGVWVFLAGWLAGQLLFGWGGWE